MDSEFDAGKLAESMSLKLKAARESLPEGKDMIDAFVAANFTEDELWVLAHSKVNGDRTSMEWEGFFISEIKNHENVKRRFETYKKLIAERQAG